MGKMMKRYLVLFFAVVLSLQTAGMVWAEEVPAGNEALSAPELTSSEETGAGEEETIPEEEPDKEGEPSEEETVDPETAETMEETASKAADAGFIETAELETKAVVNVPPSEGLYEIVSAINKNYCMDISGGSRENKANLQLYQRNGTNAQKFYVRSVGEDVFEIVNANSVLCLDVYGNKKTSGANVQQYESNGTLAQRFRFIGNNKDGYEIQGLGSELFLDAEGRKAQNKTNIQIYKRNGTTAQKWFLQETKQKLPAYGLYEIQSALDRNYVIDVCAGILTNKTNIQLYQKNNSNAQKFYLIPTGEGDIYTIQNGTSLRYLDADGNKKEDGTNIQIYDGNGTTAQQFHLIPVGDGSFELQGVGSGKNIDVKSASIKNGANIQIYEPNGTKAQRWYIVPTELNQTKGFARENGKYYFYQNGKKVVGWKKLSGYFYYFNANGEMQVSKQVYGKTLDADGRAVKNSLMDSIKPGGKTLKNYLQNAIVPCGRTLYIWAGGWNTADSQKIGYLSSWERFFNEKATPDYNSSKYKYQVGCGLDCSGYVSWITYNTLYTKNNEKYLVKSAKEIAEYYVKSGYATKKSIPTKFSQLRPGDICSTETHVYVCLGTCSDGSALLIHSAGKGVQLSGTPDKNYNWNSESIRLATQYMKNYFPEWLYGAWGMDTDSLNLKAVSSWKNDPDNMKSKSANEVLKIIFGE